MYTIERANVYEDLWSILDPDGVVIATVVSEENAEILLSHLNR